MATKVRGWKDAQGMVNDAATGDEIIPLPDKPPVARKAKATTAKRKMPNRYTTATGLVYKKTTAYIEETELAVWKLYAQNAGMKFSELVFAAVTEYIGARIKKEQIDAMRIVAKGFVDD